MSQNRLSKTVHILNPLFGGSKYTSLRGALDFVRRGEAEFRPKGVKRFEDIQGLWFSDETQELRRLQANHRQEREITAARNGVFWWNGADPGTINRDSGQRIEAHHLPFQNVSIPGPGKPWCARWIRQQA